MRIKRALLLSLFFFLAGHPFIPLTAQDEAPKTQNESTKTVTPPPLSPEEILREDAVEGAEESNFYREFFNMLLTLGFLIFLLFGISWFLRRMNLTRVQFANESSAIKIFDQRTLSPRSTLFVVQYKGKEYFIGESQYGINVLGSTELKIEETPPPKKFME